MHLVLVLEETIPSYSQPRTLKVWIYTYRLGQGTSYMDYTAIGSRYVGQYVEQSDILKQLADTTYLFRLQTYLVTMYV